MTAAVAFWQGAAPAEAIGTDVFNQSGSELLAGQVIRLEGATELLPAVVLASADTAAHAQAFGIIQAHVAPGTPGYVQHYGVLLDIDTSAFSVGDTLYLSDVVPGGLTTIPPTIAIHIGVVVVAHASQGEIQLDIQPVGGSGGGGTSGFSGYSGIGTSGFSGYSGIGTSGFSGYSGTNGATGTSGFSGYSGIGTSGFSGYSGTNGATGTSGFSGYLGIGTSGFSGYSGTNGATGTSGFSGYSGIGTSGFSGYSGTNGATGTSGFSGYSGIGTSGFSGYSGTNGATGTSGFSGYSSTSGFSGISGYSGNATGVFTNGENVGNAATSATTGTMTVNMTTATITITPTGACTFNASGGAAGQIVTFLITTSGVSSFTLTWGTNYHKTGTLATGTTSARFFAVTFRCASDGITWWEIARTAVQT